MLSIIKPIIAATAACAAGGENKFKTEDPPCVLQCLRNETKGIHGQNPQAQIQ